MVRNVMPLIAALVWVPQYAGAEESSLRTLFFQYVRSGGARLTNVIHAGAGASDVKIRAYSRNRIAKANTVGPETPLPTLLAWLRDDNPLIRRAAAWAIAETEPVPRRLEPLLVLAARDPDPTVREAVNSALFATRYDEPSPEALRALGLTEKQLGRRRRFDIRRSRRRDLPVNAPRSEDWSAFLTRSNKPVRIAHDRLGSNFVLILELLAAYDALRVRRLELLLRRLPQSLAMSSKVRLVKSDRDYALYHKSMKSLVRIGQAGFLKLFEREMKSRTTSMQKLVTIADFNPALLDGYTPGNASVERIRSAVFRQRHKFPLPAYSELVTGLIDVRDRMNRDPAIAAFAAGRYSVQDQFPLCIRIESNDRTRSTISRRSNVGPARAKAATHNPVPAFQLPRAVANRELMPMLSDPDQRVRTAVWLAYAIHGTADEFVQAAFRTVKADRLLPDEAWMTLLKAVRPRHDVSARTLSGFYRPKRPELAIVVLDAIDRLKHANRDARLLLLNGLADTNPIVSTRARLVIRKRKLTKALVENDLLPQLKTKEPRTLKRTLRQIDVMGTDAAPLLPELRSLLKTAQKEARYDVALAYTSVSSNLRDRVQWLTKALKSNRPAIRLKAVRRLAAFGTRANSAMPDLLLLLNDPDSAVATAALDAVKVIGKQEP